MLLTNIQDTGWRESYPSAEMQLVYSTVPANRAIEIMKYS